MLTTLLDNLYYTVKQVTVTHHALHPRIHRS